jgi:aspartyl-tRNA(Asn)/glutamyl-tRNA(Gln) amidotransferase subunit A
MPSSSPGFWSLTVTDAARLLAAREISPVELVEACLARIEAVDGRINSYIHVAREEALAAARDAEREIAADGPRSPLHGIPYGVKDNYDVAGMAATSASRVRLGHVPSRDAALVSKLRAAGAVLMGKLATWEYGTGNGGEYFDLPFPPARNPWDTDRFTGGSSTGAGTSVAAGTALFALGSDTTGSVRLPAAATGTVGLIATAGVLDRTGILPNCYTLDKPGILAWTARDAAAILGQVRSRGASAIARTQRGLRGARLALVEDPGSGYPMADPSMARAFAAAVDVLRSEGATIERVALPVSVKECFAVTRLIGPPESAAIHEKELRERPEDLGYALRDKLFGGTLVSAVDYIAAQRRRRHVAEAIDALLAPYDALVTFGPLHLPPRLGVEPEMTAYTVETMLTPFNLSDHPALTQCIGFTGAGLPLAWQIVGHREGEDALLDIAAAYEDVTSWRTGRALAEAA